jgi:hypothetical protein
MKMRVEKAHLKYLNTFGRKRKWERIALTQFVRDAGSQHTLNVILDYLKNSCPADFVVTRSGAR